MYFGVILNRPVTVEEVDDTIRRLSDAYYRVHPDEKIARDAVWADLLAHVEADHLR